MIWINKKAKDCQTIRTAFSVIFTVALTAALFSVLSLSVFAAGEVPDPGLHITFDGDTKDETGTYQVETKGNIEYQDGIVGKAALLGRNYAYISSFDPGESSFSFAV